MATSGYIETQATSYDTVRLSWQRTTYSIQNNQSTISWTLSLIAGSSGYISSSGSKAWSVVINGTAYSGSNSVGINNNTTKTLASGTSVIPHNADGTKTFSYSFAQDFNISWGGNNIGTIRGSGTGTLDTIPRGATLTDAPNFLDTDNPTITYSNPAGSAVYGLQACISWTGADDISYRNIPTNGTSYTFNFTATERAKLRAAVTSGTTLSVRFYVTTWFSAGGNPTYSTLNRTFTLTNSSPVITSVTAIDIREDTVALTGNENIWIKGQSSIGYNIAAEGRQGATISEYRASIGNQLVISDAGTIERPLANILYATVTDNRGVSTTQAVYPGGFIDYTYITCGLRNIKFDVDGEQGKLNFTIAGNYFNASFGAVENEMSILYRYKVEGAEYPEEWTSAEPVVTDNGYSSDISLAGLDYTKNYYVQAKAADKLSSYDSPEYKVDKVVPIFDWSNEDFNFNVPIKINNVTMPYIVDNLYNGYWYYRKWSNGIAELWGQVEATYQEPHYLSTYAAYPMAFTAIYSATGTLNNFTGNLSAYLTTNPKVEAFTYGANVWVQNSNNSFTESDTGQVSLYIIGRWK